MKKGIEIKKDYGDIVEYKQLHIDYNISVQLVKIKGEKLFKLTRKTYSVSGFRKRSLYLDHEELQIFKNYLQNAIKYTNNILKKETIGKLELGAIKNIRPYLSPLLEIEIEVVPNLSFYFPVSNGFKNKENKESIDKKPFIGIRIWNKDFVKVFNNMHFFFEKKGASKLLNIIKDALLQTTTNFKAQRERANKPNKNLSKITNAYKFLPIVAILFSFFPKISITLSIFGILISSIKKNFTVLHLSIFTLTLSLLFKIWTHFVMGI